MKDDAALDYAIAAGRAWGGFTSRPVMIRNRENVVMKAQLTNGQDVAVRLHRLGYQSKDSILSELVWTQAMADAGFPCPKPIATADGTLVHQGEGPIVSVITWLDAGCVGEMGAVYAGIESDHCELYHRIGGLIAQMHQTTDALDLAPQPRPAWSQDGLLGDTPWWGRFWENPCLTQAETVILQEARLRCAAFLDGLDRPDYGLIHADLLQENILQNETGLWVIDFDDAGYGYRLFDLGTALIQHAECAYLPALRAALIDGYSAARGVSVDDHAVQVFTLLRAFASSGWIMSRADANDPRQRFYCNRALRLVNDLSI